MLYLLSCNLNEILVIGLASVVNAPLPILPLQILFLNLVTDVFPALALGVGESDRAAMREPPRDPQEPILALGHWLAIGGYGVIITLGVLGAFRAGLRLGRSASGRRSRGRQARGPSETFPGGGRGPSPRSSAWVSERDTEAMEHDHSREAIRRRLAEGQAHSYLRDWVYGGIDGAVTTFAIVAGVVGAQLSSGIILILGIANLLADGLSMAAGNYLATRAEHDELRHAEAIERRHIALAPEGEREEVREILRSRGIHGELLERVVEMITADRDRWVRLMLRFEYGLPARIRSAWRAAGATLSAFVLCGLVPLVPFIVGTREPFWTAAGATGFVFAAIGAVKSRWSTHSWWRSALETLAIGGGAAAVAYGIGAWLRSFVG